MITLQIQNHTFQLHPTGAMYWLEEEMLLISDVHLGKVSHFRKFGSAVPQKAVQGNFLKLKSVVDFFKPKKICFLGDLFHSSLNKEWLFFENWKNSVSAEVLLIEGNHDIISPLKYEKLSIKVLPELIINEFLLTHHPEDRENCFNLSGHIHPGVRLYGKARQELKLPCFFKTKNQLILPAFGEFTGKHLLTPKEGDQVFVLGNEEVILLPMVVQKKTVKL